MLNVIVNALTFRRKIAAVDLCCPPQEKQTRQPIELRYEKKKQGKISVSEFIYYRDSIGDRNAQKLNCVKETSL